MFARTNNPYYSYHTTTNNYNRSTRREKVPLVILNNNSHHQPKKCYYDNPLLKYKTYQQHFVDMNTIVQKNIIYDRTETKQNKTDVYRKAGPTKKLFFNPKSVNAAILNAGGLCPGINNIVYDLVFSLEHVYNVNKIYGIKNGYTGIIRHNMLELNMDAIEGIQHQSGSFLGTSRGSFDPTLVLDYLQYRKIQQLFIIGGDGTHKGAFDLFEHAKKRKQTLSIACLPKTIDNDLPIIDKSFGFDTAVEAAKQAIMAAHSEARSTENGIGIVKLMGRSCGWIAMYSSLASYNVDICMIPERNYDFERVIEYVDYKLNTQGHCVIVIAEGVDTNIKGVYVEEKNDIGVWLRENIRNRFPEACVKYIDPTYLIRALPANCSDSIYCKLLAQSAVHAAMSGVTGFTVGSINGKMCIIPLCKMVNDSNKIPLDDKMWIRLVQSNLQPDFS